MLYQQHQAFQPESHRWNNGRYRMPYFKGLAPVFFVVMFLLSVYMSITNMRHAFHALPDVLDPYKNRLDNFVPDIIDLRVTEPRMEEVFRIVEDIESNKLHVNPIIKEDTIYNTSNTDSNAIQQNANETFILDGSANGRLSSLNFSLPPILSTTPNDNNTAVSLVAMGGLANTFMVERCIRSIRIRGNFFGPIILFTDTNGYKNYKETIPFLDNRTIIIEGLEEDLYPREKSVEGEGKNQTPPLKKYAQETMIFKRFKTHHSKYIEADPNLSDSIRFVVYIDVDNIIGSPMASFFEEYTRIVSDRYQSALDFHRNFTSTLGNSKKPLTRKTNKSIQNDFGFMSMFRDRHLKSKMHSGIIVYDRAFETQCVDAWRNEMDTYWEKSDQSMFLRVLDDYDRYRCTVFDLPLHHMNFANKRIMSDSMEERQGRRPKRYKPLQFPTFIHVTQYRVRQLNNATIHNEFVRHLLKLNGNESMTDTISWEDAISPSAHRQYSNQ